MDINQWIEQGKQLEEQLLTERTQLLARIGDIDTALAALGRKTPEQKPARKGRGRRPAREEGRLTAADYVRHALAGNPPLMRKEILKRLGKAVKPSAVDTTLYQLSLTGEIVKAGTHGQQTYALKRSNGAAHATLGSAV